MSKAIKPDIPVHLSTMLETALYYYNDYLRDLGKVEISRSQIYIREVGRDIKCLCFQVPQVNYAKYFIVREYTNENVLFRLMSIKVPNPDNTDIGYNCVLAKQSDDLIISRCLVTSDGTYYVQLKFVVCHEDRMQRLLAKEPIPVFDWYSVIRKYFDRQALSEHLQESDYDLDY